MIIFQMFTNVVSNQLLLNWQLSM